MRPFPLGYGSLNLRRSKRMALSDVGVDISLPVIAFFVQARRLAVVAKGALVYVSSFAVTFLGCIGNGA
jgi:hypothetical protein